MQTPYELLKEFAEFHKRQCQEARANNLRLAVINPHMKEDFVKKSDEHLARRDEIEAAIVWLDNLVRNGR